MNRFDLNVKPRSPCRGGPFSATNHRYRLQPPNILSVIAAGPTSDVREQEAP